jgi:hypothetical protein
LLVKDNILPQSKAMSIGARTGKKWGVRQRGDAGGGKRWKEGRQWTEGTQGSIMARNNRAVHVTGA